MMSQKIIGVYYICSLPSMINNYEKDFCFYYSQNQ